MLRRGLLGLLLWCAATVNPVLAGSTASDWTSLGHDAQHTNFNSAETVLGPTSVAHLHLAWSRRGNLAVSGDSMVFTAVSGLAGAYAVEVINGRGRLLRAFARGYLQLGSSNTDAPDALAYVGGRLIVASDTATEAVEQATGKIDWRVPYGATSLAISNGVVFTGNGCSGSCPQSTAQLAIDLGSGRILWRTPGSGGGEPVLAAGRLLRTWGAGSAAETGIYDPVAGRALETMPFGGYWTGDARSMYAVVPGSGHGAGWVGRVDTRGRVIWKVTVPAASPAAAPVLAYNTLYVRSGATGIAAIGTTGKKHWATSPGTGAAALAGANHVLFALRDSAGELDALSMAQGKVLARIAIPGYHHSAAPGLMVAGGAVYVTDGVRIYAFQP